MTTNVDYPTMVAAVTCALNAIAELLLDDPSVKDPSHAAGSTLRHIKEGRSVATEFEKTIITPFVTENHNRIQDTANAALAQLPGQWHFTFNNLTPAEGERPSCDFWIHLHAHHQGGATETIRQMVNAKYTTGTTADNTGGALMLGWAMTGDETCKPGELTMSALFDSILASATVISDYFFWVFFRPKHLTGQPLAYQAHTTSLLSADPDTSLVFNSHQTWPCIQMKHTRPAHTITMDITQTRVRLFNWQAGHNRARLQAAYQAAEAAYEISEQYYTTPQPQPHPLPPPQQQLLLLPV